MLKIVKITIIITTAMVVTKTMMMMMIIMMVIITMMTITAKQGSSKFMLRGIAMVQVSAEPAVCAHHSGCIHAEELLQWCRYQLNPLYVLITVVAYMMKDRIKEWGKRYLQPVCVKFGFEFPDRIVKVSGNCDIMRL